MSMVYPANIFFETGDEGDIAILEYYPPLKDSKRIKLSRKEWGQMKESKSVKTVPNAA